MSDPKRDREEEYVAADDAVIGRAFRWSVVVIGLLVVVVVAIVLWTRRETPAEPIVVPKVTNPPAPLRRVETLPDVRFTDITRASGIDFVHENGAEGERLLPETMGGGAAFLDYDGDGDQDLLLVNSTRWPHASRPRAQTPPALYRNDGSGRFENVTVGSGLDVDLYGMGVAAGDYDGDGDVDLFLTAVGPNRLFRNDGGVFRDVSAEAGVAGDADRWSTSAGFFDADRDGDLDLYVSNYVAWSREIDLRLDFQIAGLGRAYGPPTSFEGAHPYLYRNDGDGTFTEVAAAAGLHVTTTLGTPMAKALAQTFVDVDDDGFLDVVVANDTVQNFLFLNDAEPGVIRFTEAGVAAGVAFDGMGRATGAMGIDAGDPRNDGRWAIGIGNFANEATSLYVQQGEGVVFADVASAEGIASPSRLRLSFGLLFLDYDLDGRIDVLQANGHLEHEINRVQASQHYRQPAQLFWNCGPEARACFAVVPEEQTGDLGAPIVGRGATCADVDGDGDLDVLLTQVGGPPALLRNEQDLGHHWLRVRLIGPPGNLDAIGARVTLRAGDAVQRRDVMPTRSYLSQVELPVTFGLGAADHVDELRVRWPGGAETSVPVERVDTTIVVQRAADA